jgi:hypothetical protein
MEKRREIPAATKPNAARARTLIACEPGSKALGMDFHDAVESEASRVRRLSVPEGRGQRRKLRELEEWVVKEERVSSVRLSSPSTSRTRMQLEWAEIGRELARLDPVLFGQALDGLRDMLGVRETARSGDSQDVPRHSGRR